MKRVMIAACVMVLVGLGAVQRSEAAAPIINSLSPNTKVAGSGTFIMSVTGSGFTSGSVVRWNGTNISTGYVSRTQLNATVSSTYVANTGTPKVTVYTSGRKGGTSNSLTFTITAPTTTTTTAPPPPPPAPSPLSITTSTLPGTTVNGSFSSNVAATGGTPAYGWSLVNSGGALPPGLTLQATGAISGTPTQSGTFTFTTQANDSASQIAQKVLSITVGADPNATTTAPPTTTGGTILFSEDFESGVFSTKWARTNIWGSLNPAISSANKRSGNYAYEQYYYVCGDSTNTACLGPTQDVNRFIYAVFDATHNPPAEGLTHFFVRAYVYFKSPEPGGAPNLMRKMIWINDPAPGTWSTLLKVDGDTAGKMSWTYGSNGSTPCGMGQFNAFTKVGTINYDTWYAVEEEIKLNTPGVNDGIVRLWVDGNLVAESTTFSHRGTCSTTVNMISFGRQAQRFNYNVINEFRYYDDIVVSDSYIGP